MSAKRKICVFSGKRGGSGAYLPLMQLIKVDPELELSILLADMHTSKEFGQTAEEVQKLFPDVQIDLIEMGTGRSDTALARSENLSVCLWETGRILAKRRPDIVLVHADRGEHLMVALACQHLAIPVAHTQGGEVSGNIDDIQRHAITKLAHIHFPETEKAAGRLRLMGEEPWRIHVVGSLYVDRIVKKMYPSPEETKKKYGLAAGEDFGIIIFHPDTYLSREENRRAAEVVYAAAAASGLTWIAVYPCSDPGYEGVISVIEKRRGDSRFKIFKNIENLDFLSLMSDARLILGNSSSAFVEAPYFKLPAVNIGKRQLGRDREENVVDAEAVQEIILDKIKYVLGDSAFRAKLARCGYSLGEGCAAEKIVKVLKTIDLGEALFRKKLPPESG